MFASRHLRRPARPVPVGSRRIRWILRHRRAVGLTWLAVGLVGVVLLGSATSRLTPATSYPGLPSYEAGLAIAHAYGNGGNDTPVVVSVHLPAGERATSGAGAAALSATWAPVAGEHGLRVVSPVQSDAPGLVLPDRGSR
jgi:hypothetical protein